MGVKTFKSGGKTRYKIVIYRKRTRVVSRVCPEGTSKAQANEYDLQEQRRVFDELRLGKTPDVDLDEAIKRFIREEVSGQKGAAATMGHAASLGQWTGGRKLAEIVEVASAYRKWSLATLKAATINRRLAILRRVANLAWRRWGWLNEPLGQKIELLPENNARHFYLTKEQVHALAAECRLQQTRDFVLIAAYTGCRTGEITGIKRAPSGGEILVAVSKNGEPRRVPVVDAIAEAVTRLPLTFNRRTITRDFDQAKKKIGMPHIRPHDLRHTTASLLLQAGVPLEVVGRILGHKSLQTTRRYAHLDTETLRNALKRIA
jgi:integrase